MKPYTSIEKLDAVLDTLMYFYDKSKTTYNSTTQSSLLIEFKSSKKTVLEITEAISKVREGILIQKTDGTFFNRWPYTSEEIQLIINRLIKDDNCERHGAAVSRLYCISFDGLVFCETGGYHQKQVDINLERERIRIANQEAKDNAKKILQWTRWASWGAVAIVIWEIIQFSIERLDLILCDC